MTGHTISLSEIALELGDRIKRVQESDLDTLYPSQGRVCKTTDTDTVFWGTGSGWVSVPESAELGAASINASEAVITALDADGAQINTDLDDADAPLNLEASAGRAMVLYPRGGVSDRANQVWKDPSTGTVYCVVSGRDNRYGVYTDNGGGPHRNGFTSLEGPHRSPPGGKMSPASRFRRQIPIIR